MSYQMIHMEVAYRLLEQLPQIENASEYILGSVAPDSVHMNPAFDIDLKIKSHMFEGCGTWSNTEDYPRWSSNIQNVFCSVINEQHRTDYRDFVIGLCVHCLTDYWNDIKIWKRLQKENIPPMKFDSFKEAYYQEARGIDQWLYQNGKNTENITRMLSKAKSFDVEGLVEKKYLEQQRVHLLNVQYDVPIVDISQYRFLSTDFLEDFIESVVSEIAKTIVFWHRKY